MFWFSEQGLRRSQHWASTHNQPSVFTAPIFPEHTLAAIQYIYRWLKWTIQASVITLHLELPILVALVLFETTIHYLLHLVLYYRVLYISIASELHIAVVVCHTLTLSSSQAGPRSSNLNCLLLCLSHSCTLIISGPKS